MRALFLSLTLVATCAAGQGFEFHPGTESSVEFQAPAIAEPGQLRVAILTDRTTGWPEGLPILAEAVEEIREAQPDLVITMGDMISGYTRDGAQWLRELEEEWSDLVEPLEVPIFPTAGNHDTRPGTRGVEDHANEVLYQRHFGPLYYAFDVGRVHFVVLYADDGLGPESQMQIGEDQLAWLEEDLSDLDADHLFVFVHRPLWMREESNWDEVHALLTATGCARAVIAGHYHHFERCPDRDGIAHFILGATGGVTWRDPLTGGLQHWGLLTVEGEQWDLDIKEVGGEWLPSDHVVQADADVRRRIEELRNEQTGAQAPLPMPGAPNHVDVPVTLRLTNPLDVELPVSVALEPGRGDEWTMSPTTLELTLAPQASEEVEVHFSRLSTSPPLLVEPQLNFTHTLTDSRGREYPVTLRRRLMWISTVALLAQPDASMTVDGRRGPLEGWESGIKAGLPTWGWSPWETREPPGEVRLVWPGDESVYLFCRISDDRLEDCPNAAGDFILSDAVVLRAVNASGEQCGVALFPLREGERQALMVTPDTPETEWPVIEGVEITARQHLVYPEIQLWEIELPLSAWLGEGWGPEQIHLVNIEVHDNDMRRFTQVRSWAPRWDPRMWAQVQVGCRPVRRSE